MTLLKDLINIPEKVGKGDFVFTLEDAVDYPEQVLSDYVVTPQLEEAFDEALGLIGSTMDLGESRAAYLHGSFGAGKSHFMAVLYLLLSHVTEARKRVEFQGMLEEHDRWLEGKNFLLVPVHMINADVEQIEDAVLTAYVERVRDLHEGVELPAVYRSAALFKDADQLRETMGDEKFFGALNQSSAADSSGLGDLAGPKWTAVSYEDARGGLAGEADHDALVGALVSNIMSSFGDVATGDQFVSLDDGLSVISKHAKGLGYDGIVLFLDELILWLATRMASLDWVKQESQKMATLRESGKASRPIPVTSFVARQRDLSELVAEHIPGVEKQSLGDSLDYSAGRFDVITLEDRNLRKIAEKRVLAPKDEAAKQQLDHAFKETLQSGAQVIDVLKTDSASTEDFREVYPFSPAFVDILVEASSKLQRERTAIRVMVQLLSDRRNEIKLGDLIPVGDLFDVLSSNADPFSPELKKQFREARGLYENQLRPQIVGGSVAIAAEVENAELTKSQLAQDRLVKTLLLAALIPQAAPLAGMTMSKLVALNHGSISTPIPGTEASAAKTTLGKIRGNVGQLKIQDGADPSVHIELAGVDTETIIRSAQSQHDNMATRRRFVKDFIWNELGLDTSETLFTRFGFDWNGVSREIEIALENVRELSTEKAESFGENWKLIVDYPFDTGDATPADDSARIEEIKEGIDSSRTIFWLPGFFTDEVLGNLGKLVTIRAILAGERLAQYASNLSVTDQTKARQILESQDDELTKALGNALAQAYGIATPKPATIDPGHKPFVESMVPGMKVQLPVGSSLKPAVEALGDQLLRYQYPASPGIKGKATPKRVKDTWSLLERAIEGDGRISDLQPAERALLKEIAEPLELGSVYEGPFVVGDEWKNRITKGIAQLDDEHPAVAVVRKILDTPDARGLTRDLSNLVILTFAAQSNYGFQLHGAPFATDSPSDLPDDAKLVKVRLPSDEVWAAARDRASKLFGEPVPELKSARNIDHYGKKILEQAQSNVASMSELKSKIDGTLNPMLGISGTTDRLDAVSDASTILKGIVEAGPEGAMVALATCEVSVDLPVLARTISRSKEVSNALSDANWELIEAVVERKERGDTKAEAILAPLVEAAISSEFAVPLSHPLGAAEASATALLTKSVSPPPTPPSSPGTISHERISVGEARELLDELDDPNGKVVDLTIRPVGHDLGG